MRFRPAADFARGVLGMKPTPLSDASAPRPIKCPGPHRADSLPGRPRAPVGPRPAAACRRRSSTAGRSQRHARLQPSCQTPSASLAPGRKTACPPCALTQAEVVMTPSEVGVYEVAHNAGKKGTLWER